MNETKTDYIKPELSVYTIIRQMDCIASSIEEAGEDDYGEL